MNIKGLEEKRNDLKSQMTALLDTAKAEERAMTEEEVSNFDNLEKEVKNIDATIEREEKIENMEQKEVKKEERELTVEEREEKAFKEYILNERAGELVAGNKGAVIPTTIANKIMTKVYVMESALLVCEFSEYSEVNDSICVFPSLLVS